MKADSTPDRSWQEIAEEASHETNPEKLIKLSKELERALDKRREKLVSKELNGCG
jgi:hypothetical protein